jgi:hypothetical protein
MNSSSEGSTCRRNCQQRRRGETCVTRPLLCCRWVDVCCWRLTVHSARDLELSGSLSRLPGSCCFCWEGSMCSRPCIATHRTIRSTVSVTGWDPSRSYPYCDLALAVFNRLLLIRAAATNRPCGRAASVPFVAMVAELL